MEAEAEAERRLFPSSTTLLTAFVGVRFLAEEVGVASCAVRLVFVGVRVASGIDGVICEVLAVVEVEGAGEGGRGMFRTFTEAGGESTFIDTSSLAGGVDAFSTRLMRATCVGDGIGTVRLLETVSRAMRASSSPAS